MCAVSKPTPTMGNQSLKNTDRQYTLGTGKTVIALRRSRLGPCTLLAMTCFVSREAVAMIGERRLGLSATYPRVDSPYGVS